MKSVRTNWWTAGVASAICLVLIVVIAMLSSTPSTDIMLKRPSTFFTDSNGARAIYLVLQRVLPSVEQLRLPLTVLKDRSRPRTLIALSPGPIGRGEADALDAWISSGGQLILAANMDWSVQKRETDRTVKDFLARHDIRSRGPVTGEAINAAVTKTIGRGRIIYVPDSYAFSNLTLRHSDNAFWLTERCTEWGGGAVFDEYHLGFGEQRGLIPLLGMFAATPWGLVCMQLALAGVVYIFGCKRRFGRPIEELPIERTNPIETVQAVAGLFKTVQARSLSARSIHQHLNSFISSIVGYRVDLMDEQTRSRLSGPMRIAKADLDSYAKASNEANSPRQMSDDDLIRFGRNATAIARSFSHGTARSKRSAAAG